MVDTLKIVKKLAHERDNLTWLLDCCERRERRHKDLRELVIELGSPYPGSPHYCWCEMTVDNPMVQEHSQVCRQLFGAVFGGEK